jgi:hypothetical protein
VLLLMQPVERKAAKRICVVFGVIRGFLSIDTACCLHLKVNGGAWNQEHGNILALKWDGPRASVQH